jgi:hypothetical protein
MGIDVTTHRYENTRIGANTRETQLNTENVSVGKFGKLFSRTVDGDLYAQPLIATGVKIGGASRDVVFLATSRNWVYAYDAVRPEETLPLWSRNLGMPVPRDDIFPGYLNFSGEIGVTSTPALELDGNGGGTLYVVAKTKAIDAAEKVFRYEIHAIDIRTGARRARRGHPVAIEGGVEDSLGRKIKFDARVHLNRPALLLDRGVLYIAFGSHSDYEDDDKKIYYYGWIMAYEAATMKKLAVYNTAPDWGQGGIWQSGAGLAADDDGLIYVVVGNGKSPKENEAKKPPIPAPIKIEGPVYGNSILKLQLTRGKSGGALEVVDWFTASDVMHLNDIDSDFVGGPVLFDASDATGAPGKFVLGGGKDGKFYLAERSQLGRWMKNENTAIRQAEQICNYHIHGAPVVWAKSNAEKVAYVWSEKDFLKCVPFDGRKFGTKPLSTSVYGFPQDELRMPGGMLTVSSDGARDGSGIVWASHPTDDDGMNKTVSGTLRAFDARDLNKELWNSDMDAAGSDRVGSFAKFCPPVVANGKVYLATFSRELVVYGLFSEVDRPDRSNYVGIFELRDIGPGVQKSGSYACARYSLRITGRGIGATQDNFLFAYVDRDSDHEPEIEVSARVEGINPSQYPDPRAGVMIRKLEQQDPADPRPYDPQSHRFAAMLITNQGQALFLHRDANGTSAVQDGPVDVTLPCFVKLTARKNPGMPGFVEFEGKISKDGLNWTTVSALTRIAIDGRLMLGLAVTAQTGAQAAATSVQAHASFSKVEIAPAVSNVTVD